MSTSMPGSYSPTRAFSPPRPDSPRTEARKQLAKQEEDSLKGLQEQIQSIAHDFVPTPRVSWDGDLIKPIKVQTQHDRTYQISRIEPQSSYGNPTIQIKQTSQQPQEHFVFTFHEEPAPGQWPKPASFKVESIDRQNKSGLIASGKSQTDSFYTSLGVYPITESRKSIGTVSSAVSKGLYKKMKAENSSSADIKAIGEKVARFFKLRKF